MSTSSASSSKNALMWIHCNKCLEIYIRKRKTVFVLSCQHIACESCAQRAPENRVICPLCNKPVDYNPIGNDLAPRFKQFFHPQPFLDFGNLNKVTRFQLKHKANYVKGLTLADSHAQKVSAENKQLKEKCKSVYGKREKLRNYRLKMEQQAIKLKKLIAEKNVEPGEVIKERLRQQVDEARNQKSIVGAARCSSFNENNSSGYFSIKTDFSDFTL